MSIFKSINHTSLIITICFCLFFVTSGWKYQVASAHNNIAWWFDSTSRIVMKFWNMRLGDTFFVCLIYLLLAFNEYFCYLIMKRNCSFWFPPVSQIWYKCIIEKNNLSKCRCLDECLATVKFNGRLPLLKFFTLCGNFSVSCCSSARVFWFWFFMDQHLHHTGSCLGGLTPPTNVFDSFRSNWIDCHFEQFRKMHGYEELCRKNVLFCII